MIVLGDETPTARVEHTCQECWRKIRPGEKYRRQRNIGDDGPYVWKVCRQCSSLLRDLSNEGYEGDDAYSYPYLPDVDWHEVCSLSEVWLHRVALWKRQWRRQGAVVEYPRVSKADR